RRAEKFFGAAVDITEPLPDEGSAQERQEVSGFGTDRSIEEHSVDRRECPSLFERREPCAVEDRGLQRVGLPFDTVETHLHQAKESALSCGHLLRRRWQHLLELLAFFGAGEVRQPVTSSPNPPLELLQCPAVSRIGHELRELGVRIEMWHLK